MATAVESPPPPSCLPAWEQAQRPSHSASSPLRAAPCVVAPPSHQQSTCRGVKRGGGWGAAMKIDGSESDGDSESPDVLGRRSPDVSARMWLVLIPTFPKEGNIDSFSFFSSSALLGNSRGGRPTAKVSRTGRLKAAAGSKLRSLVAAAPVTCR